MTVKSKVRVELWSNTKPPVMFAWVEAVKHHGQEKGSLQIKGFSDPDEVAEFFEAFATDLRESAERIQ